MRGENLSTIAYAQRYLADFDLDAGQLGALIAAGKQHYLYRYGAGQVIKVPKPTLYMRAYGAFEYGDIVRDVALLTEFLPEFIPETTVFATPAHRGYVVVQEYLHDAQFLTYDLFMAVENQFARLIAGNRALVQAHQYSVDFYGNLGFRRSLAAALLRRHKWAMLTNLLVVNRGSAHEIKIVDVNLSSLRRSTRISETTFGWVVDRLMYTASRRLLRHNFGVKL